MCTCIYIHCLQLQIFQICHITHTCDTLCSQLQQDVSAPGRDLFFVQLKKGLLAEADRNVNVLLKLHAQYFTPLPLILHSYNHDTIRIINFRLQNGVWKWYEHECDLSKLLHCG